jgi:hypothetical protein
MVKTYTYEVSGHDGGGKTWIAKGQLLAPAGRVQALVHAALGESFQKLTNGDTGYGKPGEGRCRGPYTVTKLVVELKG